MNIDKEGKIVNKGIENELFLKMMTKTSPFAFFVVDNRTDEILHFNHKFCEIWGITHLEAQMQRGELTNNQIIPDCLAVLADVPAFAESCKPLQSEENRITIEDYIPFLDGRTIRRFSTQIRGENDAYFGRFYLFEDISQQKNVEAKLRESEANFRTFFETVDDIFLVGSPEGKIIYANAAALAKLGYTLEELIGMHILDVHPAEKRAEAEVIFGDMFAGKRSSCPLPLGRKDKSYLPVETRVWFGKWDGMDCIFGISKDLTLQQAAFDKFQKIFDNNPALMAVTNLLDKKFTDVNSTFLNNLGYTKEEVIGKTSTEIGLFIENEKQGEALNVLLQEGKLINFELQAKKKDGGIIDGLFSGEIIDNQLEQSYLTVMNDITEIRKIERDLVKTEENFSSIMNNMLDFVWSSAWPSLENFYVSPSAKDLFGVDECVVNKNTFNWNEFIHPEDKQSLSNKLATLEELGNSQHEFRIIRANGEIIWVDERMKLIYDRNKQPIRVDGIIRDITAKKKQDEQIEYYSTMQDLILKISSVYINIDLSEFENILEESLQELAEFVGADRSYIFDYDFVKNTTSNTHEWCSESINAEIMNLQNIPLVAIPQWVEKHALGEAFYVDDVSLLPQDGIGGLREVLEPQGIKSLITVPMLSDGILIGFVGFDAVKSKHFYTDKEKELLVIFAQMLVNVKKRINTEQSLHLANEEAIRANNIKTQFLSNMSHEIRTPINGLIAYVELLNNFTLTEKQHDYLDKIKSSSKLLLAIINDILDLDKIESKNVILRTERFNLRASLDAAANLLQQIIELKGLKILINIEENVPSNLIGDSIRLQQILANLLSNAVKYTNKGEVVVRVKVAENCKDYLRLHFSIRDTGIGIEEEVGKHIFEPFYQVDTENSRSYSGTGLGLAITKKYVELFGGEIWFQSEIGSGSTFFFTACFNHINKNYGILEPNNQFIFKAPRREIIEQLEGMHVLVVEDNELNQDVLFEILHLAKIKVTMTHSGAAAVAYIKKKNYDMVLMDIRMPDMDGYQATKEIRKFRSFEDLPIIAVSASSFLDEKEKCLEAGINDFISKPITTVVLFNKMALWHKHSSIPNVLAVAEEFVEYHPIEEKIVLDELTREIVKVLEPAGIDYLKALSSLEYNEELLKKILRKFHKNQYSTIVDIKKALSCGKLEIAERLVHTVKGVAGHIAAEKVVKSAIALENALKNKQLAELNVLTDDLDEALLEAFNALGNLNDRKLVAKGNPIGIADFSSISSLKKELALLLQENDMASVNCLEGILRQTECLNSNEKFLDIKACLDDYRFEAALQILKELD
ncbi:MAG: PAS domain S-box protein [Clostridia bacterium]